MRAVDAVDSRASCLGEVSRGGLGGLGCGGGELLVLVPMEGGFYCVWRKGRNLCRLYSGGEVV